MSLIRVILAIVFPPLAVIDKGFGSFILVTILTVLGFIPGILAALIIVGNEKPKYVQVQKEPDFMDKAKAFEQKIKVWSDKKVAEREAKKKQQQ